MAEIEMERRPRRPVWPWLLVILVLAVVGVGAWLLLGQGRNTLEGDPGPDIQQTTEPGQPSTTAPGQGPADRDTVFSPPLAA